MTGLRSRLRNLTERHFALLLFVLLLGALPAIGAVYYCYTLTVDDGRLISIAGRQRLLAEQLQVAHASDRGPDAASAALSAFREGLAEMRRNAEAPRYAVAGGAVREAVDQLEREWQAAAGFAATLPDGAARRAEIADALSDLGRTTDRAVIALEQRHASIDRYALAALLLAVVLVLVPFVLIASLAPRRARSQAAAEQALRDSELRRRRSQDYANIGTWDWNIQTGELYWSERIGPLFGYARELPATTYENFLKAVHPDDRQRVVDAVNACVERDAPYDIEHRIVWPDGSVRWMQEAGGVERAPDGRPLRMLGVVRDITARKEVEQELIDSEAKYRALMEEAGDAMLLADPSGNLIEANRAAERLLGYARTDLLQMHYTRLHPPEELARVSAAFHDIARKGSGIYSDGIVVRPDGTRLPVDIHGAVIRYRGREVVQGIFRDMSAHKRREDEALARERRHRETLVREVHHRIKNNLQGVVGLLRQQISAAPGTGFRLERVITQVNAMALVHGLQSHDASERIYLCDMIEAIAQAVAGLAGVTVRCSTTRAQRGPIALASDETVPLALIVNELMMNAVKHRAPESPDITVKAEREDQLARVEITNRSGGPAAEFDWARGQGLGTGLQLVRSLMPHAGARLSIEPRAGEMVATLTLWAPAIELGAVVGTARQASASA